MTIATLSLLCTSSRPSIGLFDYKGPADIIDVLIAGSLYLLKLANGQFEPRKY